jgi:hypothetical protein
VEPTDSRVAALRLTEAFFDIRRSIEEVRERAKRPWAFVRPWPSDVSKEACYRSDLTYFATIRRLAQRVIELEKLCRENVAHAVRTADALLANVPVSLTPEDWWHREPLPKSLWNPPQGGTQLDYFPKRELHAEALRWLIANQELRAMIGRAESQCREIRDRLATQEPGQLTTKTNGDVIASPQAIATGLIIQGWSMTDIADHLGIRRQDFYEKPEWAVVLHLHKTRGDARQQSRRDRRAVQDPDAVENRDDT